MFCSYFGKEIANGSNFCIHCGADLRGASVPKPEPTPAPEPTPTPTPTPTSSYTASSSTPAAKPKKKKGWFTRILVLLLAILIGRGVGYLLGYGFGSSMNRSSGSTSSRTSSSNTALSTIAPIQDLITRHTTVMLDEGEGFTDYMTIFYGNDSHYLTGWTVEYFGEKDAGYSLDLFKSAGWESMFPSFATFDYTETSDYVCFTARMKDLTKVERVQALIDAGLIEALADGEELRPLDADYLVDSLKAAGWTEAPIGTTGHLHFD